MSLTFTREKSGPAFLTPYTATPVRVAFDSSYLAGGEVPTGSGFNANRITGIQVMDYYSNPNQTYKAQFNKTTKKFQVFKKSPALRVKETVTVSSNVGTLACVPGYILSVNVTAGTVTGAFAILPTGLVPTTTQVAVNFLTGVMTFLSTDAVTSVDVMYIPLGVGPFIEQNRVVDEAVVFGSGAGDTFNLANRAALIQYVCNTTATAANRLPAMQPVGEAPATNEIAVDFNNSSATTITHNTAQDTNTGKVTYWKFSAIGVQYGWTDQADITVTSNVALLSEITDAPGILIPGYGTKLVGEATATNKQQRIVGPAGAAATDVAVFDPTKNSLTFDAGDSITTVEIPYIVLDSAFFTDVWVEVPSAENLSTLSVQCVIWEAQ